MQFLDGTRALPAARFLIRRASRRFPFFTAELGIVAATGCSYNCEPFPCEPPILSMRRAENLDLLCPGANSISQEHHSPMFLQTPSFWPPQTRSVLGTSVLDIKIQISLNVLWITVGISKTLLPQKDRNVRYPSMPTRSPIDWINPNDAGRALALKKTGTF